MHLNTGNFYLLVQFVASFVELIRNCGFATGNVQEAADVHTVKSVYVEYVIFENHY